MEKIEVKNLVKVYPFSGNKKNRKLNPSKHYTNEGELVIRDLSLRIEANDFFVLLGPSGCGKTTLLRMIAGLEDISAGSVFFGDRLMNSVKVSDRSIAMVTQDSGLYPHLTVEENIASPLAAEMEIQDDISVKVNRIMKILHIDHLRNKKPRELSGGERQLTAIGRAIVKGAGLILFDEPLSNLDEQSRNRIRTLLIKLHNDYPLTFIYVTHSQEEALALADHLAIMNEGKIVQSGSPENLYYEPVNEYVASFLGMPPMNIVKSVQIKSTADKASIEILGKSYSLSQKQSSELVRKHVSTVDIGIRPFYLQIAADGMEAVIELVETIESEHFLHLAAYGEHFIVATRDNYHYLKGMTVHVQPKVEEMIIFDTITKQRII